jgi:hypothetical protein
MPAIGAWPNFYLTLLELVLGKPKADAILIVQDDAQFYDRENLRDYLGSILWPRETPGIVSLYCSAAYTREAAGWAVCDTRWEWGALAFVFPLDRNAIPIWYPTPSLVQHIGETSTVWPGVPAAGFRRADFFAGDLCDSQDVLSKSGR